MKKVRPTKMNNLTTGPSENKYDSKKKMYEERKNTNEIRENERNRNICSKTIMYMYVCVYLCVYTYIYIYTHTNISTHTQPHDDTTGTTSYIII